MEKIVKIDNSSSVELTRRRLIRVVQMKTGSVKIYNNSSNKSKQRINSSSNDMKETAIISFLNL